MKPYLHAKLSAKKYGGDAEEYLEFHDFFDSSKSSVADVRHRAMLHSAWGIYLAERVFGPLLILKSGKKVSTRDLGEDHVLQDLGFIPTMQDWLRGMPIEGWMSGTVKKRTVITFEGAD